MDERTFPIQSQTQVPTVTTPCPTSVPWGLAEKHRSQIERNHGRQTLERLKERHGLSPGEFVAACWSCNWYQLPKELQEENGARAELLRIVREYEENDMCSLRADLETSERELDDAQKRLSIAEEEIEKLKDQAMALREMKDNPELAGILRDVFAYLLEAGDAHADNLAENMHEIFGFTVDDTREQEPSAGGDK